jgi:hypothetical protein
MNNPLVGYLKKKFLFELFNSSDSSEDSSTDSSLGFSDIEMFTCSSEDESDEEVLLSYESVQSSAVPKVRGFIDNVVHELTDEQVVLHICYL